MTLIYFMSGLIVGGLATAVIASVFNERAYLNGQGDGFRIGYNNSYIKFQEMDRKRKQALKVRREQAKS